MIPSEAKEPKADATVISPAKSTSTCQEPQQNADNRDEKEQEEEMESAPEDLKDFIVLDEAEITEPEDDVDSNGETKQWDCPAHRLAPRTYLEADFSPTTPDPRCKPDWPLAAYWPVYVGNFRLYRRYDGDYNCTHAVQKYFASKGIPAFMVFRRKDSFFEDYQKRVGFYDMLVYFCCEKDANRAIQWCHRDLYYGHCLNVCNGRTPDVFPRRKSWRFEHMIVEDKLESETNIESYLRHYDDIKYVSKQDLDGVFVQFSSIQRKGTESFLDDERFLAIPIDGTVRKQRFVEQDVEEELRKEIAENPKFMKLRPKRDMLNSLKHGVIPVMRRLWENDEVDVLPNHQFTHARGDRQRVWRKRQAGRLDIQDDDGVDTKKPFTKFVAGERKKKYPSAHRKRRHAILRYRNRLNKMKTNEVEVDVNEVKPVKKMKTEIKEEK